MALWRPHREDRPILLRDVVSTISLSSRCLKTADFGRPSQPTTVSFRYSSTPLASRSRRMSSCLTYSSVESQSAFTLVRTIMCAGMLARSCILRVPTKLRREEGHAATIVSRVVLAPVSSESYSKPFLWSVGDRGRAPARDACRPPGRSG